MIKNAAIFACFIILSFGVLKLRADEGISVPMGQAKLNLLLQMWALDDTNATVNSNFRPRRAEIKLSGSVAPGTRWFVMFDPAKNLQSTLPGSVSAPNVSVTWNTNDNKVLQDLGVAYSITPELEFVAGQFKIPTTAEGLGSSAELILPERSYVGRAFGDLREPGAMLQYTMKPFMARLMASNGIGPGAGNTATNVDDTNNSKDLNGRIDYTINDNFKVGVFTGYSNSLLGNSSVSGGNVQFNLERLMIRAEGAQAKLLTVDQNGLNLEGTYLLSDAFQAAVRYDNYQVTTAPVRSSNAYTIGLNYFVSSNNAKIQAAYTNLGNFTGNNGTYKPAAGNDGSLVILNFQASL